MKETLFFSLVSMGLLNQHCHLKEHKMLAIHGEWCWPVWDREQCLTPTQLTVGEESVPVWPWLVGQLSPLRLQACLAGCLHLFLSWHFHYGLSLARPATLHKSLQCTNAYCKDGNWAWGPLLGGKVRARLSAHPEPHAKWMSGHLS